MPQKLFPRDLFRHAQPLKHSDAFAALVQGGLTTAQTGGRPWHHPHSAGSAGMQGAGVGRSPLRFQRKTWGPGGMWQESFWAAPERVICEAEKEVEAGLKIPELRDASNMDCLLREVCI